jgi:hypothetical protein
MIFSSPWCCLADLTHHSEHVRYEQVRYVTSTEDDLLTCGFANRKTINSIAPEHGTEAAGAEHGRADRGEHVAGVVRVVQADAAAADPGEGQRGHGGEQIEAEQVEAEQQHGRVGRGAAGVRCRSLVSSLTVGAVSQPQ